MSDVPTDFSKKMDVQRILGNGKYPRNSHVFLSVLFINKQTHTELSVMSGREKDILFTLLGFQL